MNRMVKLLAPLLSFAVGAVLAGILPPGKFRADGSGNLEAASRTREGEDISRADRVTGILAVLEDQLRLPSPAPEKHDGAGMEKHCEAFQFTGGHSAFEYGMEWAEDDPHGMLAWLVKGRVHSRRYFFSPASILFKEWARNDREEAISALSRIPDLEIRLEALVSTMEVICGNDPARARNLMLEHWDLFGVDSARPVTFISDRQDIILDMLESLPPSRQKTKLVARTLDAMVWYSDGRKELAITRWANAPEAQRREWVEAGFTSNRENAALFAGLEDLMRENAENSGDAGSFLKIQGPGWAQRDLAGALAWIGLHLKGESRMQHSADLFEPAAIGDLDNALQVWQNLPAGILKDRAARKISENAASARKAEVDAILSATQITRPHSTFR